MARRSTDPSVGSLKGLLLLDSCILIDSLRGYDPSISWLRSVASRYDVTLSISVVTIAELLSGVKSEDDYSTVDLVLSQFGSIPIDAAIAFRAGRYLRGWRQSHGLRTPDALIAATAGELGAVLITRDASHFPMEDVNVSVPY